MEQKVKYYAYTTTVDIETGEIIKEDVYQRGDYVKVRTTKKITYDEHNGIKYGKIEHTREVKPNPQQSLKLF